MYLYIFYQHQCFEIYLNQNNIVRKFKEYSERDALNIEISDKTSKENKDSIFIWKEILNNMRRKNVQN